MSEPEARRSARSTKGQHKGLEEESAAPAKPRPQSKKASKKSQKKEPEPEAEEDDEGPEIIRCVCGATEDEDEDSEEPWIGCDDCQAWQHNICMGISHFEDDVPDTYRCEQCRPDDHRELLEGMAKGEKPWEDRRRIHEEEQRKMKKKGGRKPKGRVNRKSASHDIIETGKEAKSTPVKPTPTPTPEPSKEKKEPVKKKEPAKGKRKTREESHDTDAKSAKVRRVSTEPAAAQASPAQPAQPEQLEKPAEPEQPVQEAPAAPPAPVKSLPKPQYTPPKDLEAVIKELPPTRSGPARLLKKSLVHVMTGMQKNQELEIIEGKTLDSMAEATALQIERAVFDTHPMAKGQKEYNQQIKSLTFNLKSNPELVRGLIEGIHTPPTLAVMTSDQLASSELQKQTAEMKAKAEKASILYQGDQSGPRVRRTHKGEEVVEDESMVSKTEDQPPPQPPGPAGPSRRTSSAVKDQGRPDKADAAAAAAEQGDISMRSPSQDEGPHRSPSQSNFDISKVFSKVRSPSMSQPRPRKPSMQVQTSVQVEDADVDRLLQEENESPPYSPTEETQDPDVVWRGSFAMSTLADFKAVAKHIGGANFANIVGPWSDLIPTSLPVAGRITQQSATEYLCSLRYSNLTDVIVVSVEPQREEHRPELNAVIEYFINKSRYGVVGLKTVGQVRDTYLVPVPAGEDNHPEFMLNLMDNNIPRVREQPMLLCVFVYRHDPGKINTSGSPVTPSQAQYSPTPGSGGPAVFAQRSNSTSGAPAFSPATPVANGPLQSTTPVPIPQVPHGRGPPPPQSQAAPQPHPHQPQPHNTQQVPPPGPQQPSDADKYRLNEEGRLMAQQVLGPDLMSAATVQFLLPQAWQMSRREWEVIKNIYIKEPRAKDDLPFMGQLLEKKGKESSEAEQKEKAAAAGGA